MLSALCLVPGFVLAQAPPPATPVVSFLAPVAIDESTAPAGRIAAEEMPGEPPAQAAAPSEPPWPFRSRPPFADRNSLSFVLGSGPGRFDLIDWESRPNRDRYWWLGRWPMPESFQFYAGIGFNFHWWAGPVTRGNDAPPDLPPHVFDLYLDWSWSQRWTERLASEVRFRPGLYTDFRTTPPDAFRVPGEAVAVLQAGPDLYLVGGAEYLQRNDIHLLPVGGVLWQPIPGLELRLIFPEPKIAALLSERRHLWGYVCAEYGGGRWTYKNEAGHSERAELSDYRLLFGVEWRQDESGKLPLVWQRSAAFLETGYVFERRVLLAAANTEYEPKPAWMIRFGYAW